MSVPANGNMLLAGEDGGYTISRSVRLRSSASAYLNRTLTTPTNNKIWTWSGWVKRGSLSNTSQGLFEAPSSGSTFASIYFTSGDIINWYDASGGATVYILQTTQVFRDPSAWYHIVCAYDSTQATAANRQKMYVNGVQITSFSTATYVAQNTNGRINSAVTHKLGTFDAGSNYLDGYLTEINFIDGQALTPTNFGTFDAVTGVWNPIRYSGTYGTNGFYLNFSDNSGATATTIGKDSSGNGNNWTPNNISVTAGTTYDSMVDTPTNYGSDTGAGGEVRGNYAVLNPLDAASAPSDGNLRFVSGGANYGVRSTIQLPTSGKWYAECILGTTTSATVGEEFGFATAAASLTGGPQSSGKYGIYADSSGYIYSNGTTITSSLGSFSSGTVLQIAYNGATGDAWVGKNNVWYNSSGGTTGNPATGANPTFTSLSSVFAYVQGVNGTQYFNAGQTAFSYTAPSGFKALCTQNLPTPTIGATVTTQASKHFNILTWQGTGNTGRSFTGLGFKPDLVWTKDRSAAYGHVLFDAVRGAGGNKELGSQSTGAEGYAATSAYDYLSSFDTDGFTSTWSGSNSAAYFNTSTHNYVAWNWKGGNTNTTISVNQYGSTPSKASTVNVNTSAGFSIATFTQTTGTFTVGHGLGVAPEFVIVKDLNASNGWICYHNKMDATAPQDYYIFLHSAAARAAGTAAGGIWQGTKPSNNLVYFGDTASWWGASGVNRVMYCFASIVGYSAFGSYTGNGSSDGPFVYCGFKPRCILIKGTDASTRRWNIVDTSRSSYNTSGLRIYAELSNAEDPGGGSTYDIVSNGFKLRDADGNFNASGVTYIYAAFAENPFNYSRAR